MNISEIFERAKALPAGETLRITKAENDAMVEALRPLFSSVKLTPEYALPCHLRGHEIEVI